MLKRVFLTAVLAYAAAGMPAYAEGTSLSDLEAYHQAKNVITEPGREFDKNHWAYQSLEYLTNKYGLLLGNKDEKFSGNTPLTRNEAAVILVNLVGKIEKEKSVLSDVDREKITTMKNEFSNELTYLTGRIEKLEQADKRSVKYGFAESTVVKGAIQAQYTGNIDGKGLDGRASNFSIPTVDVTLTGQIRPHLDYFINTFPSRNFTSATNGLLGDVWLATDIIPYTKLYFGQKRKPLGLEGMQSPYTLDTIERAQISRIFGDKRDTGITAIGNWKFIDYAAGTYNGNGINSNDTNSGQEMAAMITFNALYNYPEYGSLKLGGVFDHNRTTFSNKLYGGIAQYISPNKKFKLQGELMEKDGYLAANQKAGGFYIHSTYFLTDKLELVTRYDLFNPDYRMNKDRKTEYTFGSNYYFYDHNLVLQGDFVYVENQLGDDSKRVMLMTQYMF